MSNNNNTKYDQKYQQSAYSSKNESEKFLGAINWSCNISKKKCFSCIISVKDDSLVEMV